MRVELAILLYLIIRGHTLIIELLILYDISGVIIILM
jgi:hypothetical protein